MHAHMTSLFVVLIVLFHLKTAINSTSNAVVHAADTQNHFETSHEYQRRLDTLSQKATKPRAVIHIGPHKTGSTHLQSFLVKNAAVLETEGFYYPQLNDGEYFDVKTAAEFGNFLKNDAKSTVSSIQITEIMKGFLRRSAKSGRNVIFSIENLCGLSRTQIQSFYNILTGFDATIIITYREWLSHFRSHYAGISLNMDIPTAPFLHMIFLEAGNQQFTLNRIVADYGAVFGLQNIVILDYYGVAAAHKDVVHVILCEIAGVMCARTALLNSRTSHRENASKTWLPRQLLDVFKSHVHANDGCHLPHENEPEVLRLFHEDLAVNKNERMPPHQKVRLDPLFSQSINFDSTLRSRHADRILYGNETANRAAMRAVEVQELLYWRIYQDSFWRNWLHDQFTITRRQGLVVSCTEKGT